MDDGIASAAERTRAPDAAAPTRSTMPATPPSSTQQQTLDEQLSRDAEARAAERGADRQLARTSNAARENQVGDVGARQQQHEHHDAAKHERRRPQVCANDGRLHRLDRHAPSFVRRWMTPARCLRRSRSARRGPVERRLRFQPRRSRAARADAHVSARARTVDGRSSPDVGRHQEAERPPAGCR